MMMDGKREPQDASDIFLDLPTTAGLGFDTRMKPYITGNITDLQLCNYCFIAGLNLCFSKDSFFCPVGLTDTKNFRIHLILHL
jgi:hypothetical protein